MDDRWTIEKEKQRRKNWWTDGRGSNIFQGKERGANNQNLCLPCILLLRSRSPLNNSSWRGTMRCPSSAQRRCLTCQAPGHAHLALIPLLNVIDLKSFTIKVTRWINIHPAVLWELFLLGGIFKEAYANGKIFIQRMENMNNSLKNMNNSLKNMNNSLISINRIYTLFFYEPS